ncbi:MAG: helix-hairpin-helix domain-containing protein [Candidatus Cloacimonadaceae bacterium]|nr:helix-hairpin-helix domain-containing protein [Candidatus Cloacimonadaceae bacterium]
MEELMSLEGVGAKKAAEIIEYRKTNGPFTSIEDFTKVKGIGIKTLEKNRERLRV